MRQFEKEYREAMPQTIGETDRQFDDHNYTEFLEKWIVKLLATPDVSVEREPVASGAVCPHFDTCQNGGKNEYCDLQTFKEIDCYMGQTER